MSVMNLLEETEKDMRMEGLTPEQVAWVGEPGAWSCGWDEFAHQASGFSYDNGYGAEEVNVRLVFTDGSFLWRGTYDGAEWWEHVSTPHRPAGDTPRDLIRESARIERGMGA